MKKMFLIPSISAIAVFIISYVIIYRSLLPYQPQNGVLPQNFTSFPPSSAWIPALIYSVVVLVILLVLNFFLPLLTKSISNSTSNSSLINDPNHVRPLIPKEMALEIARADVEKIYRNDPNLYNIEVNLKNDGWHVDYSLKNPELGTKGGGAPHYIINDKTGEIIKKWADK